jgi:hypothetical protein
VEKLGVSGGRSGGGVNEDEIKTGKQLKAGNWARF